MAPALAEAHAFISNKQAPAAAPAAAAPAAKPSPEAYVKDAENGSLLLKTPYHKDFILTLKTQIPYASRSWDGLDKVWKVAPAYKDAALAILAKFFPAADTSAAK